MKPETNKWIDEVLDSTAGMEPARSPKDMFDNIMNMARRQPVRTISLATLSAAAACLLILFSANFIALRGHRDGAQEPSQVGSLAEYYDLGTSNPYGL
jgi:hypothetical protein